jgi:hypothetical protein
LADRGYDSDGFRDFLKGNNADPRYREGATGRSRQYDKQRTRNGADREMFGKLKENRRLAVRCEKSDMNVLGFICFGFIKILLC